jgi:hypothetical protein
MAKFSIYKPYYERSQYIKVIITYLIGVITGISLMLIWVMRGVS